MAESGTATSVNRRSKGKIESGYSLINVIGLFDAADRNASKMKLGDDGRMHLLYSFKIDPEKVKGQRLFRILGAAKSIIIDETLKNALIANEVPAGVWIYPTEDYDGWGYKGFV